MKPTILLAGLLALPFSHLATAQSTRSIPNFANANLVLGDADFRGGGPPAPAASSFSFANDVAVDPVTRKVFVADVFRVLRFASADALANGAAAEAVFGQGNFDTQTSPSTPNESRFAALGICLDRNGRLWVADPNNRRVLRFDGANTAGNFPAATRVYGQPNFTDNSFRVTSATSIAGPTDVLVDSNDRLWVVDSGVNRILRFDDISNKPNGAAADGVLGQTSFTGVSSGLSQSKMESPRAIDISANGTLFVSDSLNNRVLRFDNAAGLANGANASAVLGQPDFVSRTIDVTASRMHNPRGLSIAADDTLWITDFQNARALRFDNASAKANGAAADGVLGQPDFFTDRQDNNNQGTFLKNSQGFLFPEYIFVDNPRGSVWVSDGQNGRVLRFGGASGGTNPPPAGGDNVQPALALSGKVPKSTKAKASPSREPRATMSVSQECNTALALVL
ncbi:MAG: hypothetical protein HC845_13445 [Akkermansiaceae bacterium]|nr:hypothetical protein [Akkermansiaceae bacterium]